MFVVFIIYQLLFKKKFIYQCKTSCFLPNCLLWTVKRWYILDVLARLPNSFPVDICLSCLSPGDALFCAWSVARLQCWWLPRLRHMASKPAVSNQGCWAPCVTSNSCFHYPNSGIYNAMHSCRFVFLKTKLLFTSSILTDR